MADQVIIDLSQSYDGVVLPLLPPYRSSLDFAPPNRMPHALNAFSDRAHVPSFHMIAMQAAGAATTSGARGFAGARVSARSGRRQFRRPPGRMKDPAGGPSQEARILPTSIAD